ncbi:hypothetical protein [Saccharibacillus kuerlensis]|uniref:SWIM-type domain-containing protein n=1 Tax=Saccharibacillus kuerlensis TaxID=459527 RepID=A0ABQ2L6F0_9BACL|nr:hypothetical protein [Saccharibacillus kuerlensis]GGO04674.1 hypothetical protein GCM10010969_30140 [Saccharibacillus kuerlensis]
MNGNTAFTDEQWHALVQSTAEAYDDLTLKRGFQYERLGHIQQLSLSDDRRLEAEVKEGDGLCRVELALDFPAGGSCDCKDRKPCRHQAAALMKLARLRGRPVSALANASASVSAAAKAARAAEMAEDGAVRGDGSLRRESAVREDRSSADSLKPGTSSSSARLTDREERAAVRGTGGGAEDGVSAEAEAAHDRPNFLSGEEEQPAKARSIELASLLAASGISAWHRRFEEAASSLTGRTRNPKFAELTLGIIFENMPPFKPGIEQLYRLNAYLFVLKTMTAPSGPGIGPSSSPGYYAHLAVNETKDGLERCLSAPLQAGSDAQVLERLEETLRLVRRQMLTEGRDQDAFAKCYYRLLSEWAVPADGIGADGKMTNEAVDVYESELQYLMDEERELGRSLNRLAWLSANAWSRFRLGQDAKAKELLKEAADKPYFTPAKLPDFFTPLAAQNQWERLSDWLEIFGPLLERARANLADYEQFWNDTLKHFPEAESRMWNVLQEMLPYASTLYGSKLMERERWEEWMDYQLSTGREPSHFKVTELAPIEKNAPELLLPFYHQAAERLIEQRSRDGYKAAVRLLKRLDKLYRKMKREDRWEVFMESFNAKYGRLRALQEELKKGKLML